MLVSCLSHTLNHYYMRLHTYFLVLATVMYFTFGGDELCMAIASCPASLVWPDQYSQHFRVNLNNHLRLQAISATVTPAGNCALSTTVVSTAVYIF